MTTHKDTITRGQLHDAAGGVQDLAKKIRQYRSGEGVPEKPPPPRFALNSMKNRLSLSPEGEIYVDDREPEKLLDYKAAYDDASDRALDIMRTFAGLIEFTALPHNEPDPVDGLRSLEQWCYVNMQRGAGESDELPANTTPAETPPQTIPRKEPPPSVKRAYGSYKWLIDQMSQREKAEELLYLLPKEGSGIRFTKEMYHYVKEHSPQYHDDDGKPINIGKLHSWTRRIRGYEQFLDGPKSTPVVGRQKPQSAMTPGEIQSLSHITSQLDRQ